MKMFKSLILVVLTLTTFPCGVAFGSQPFGPADYPVELIIEPTPMPTSAGPVNMKLTLISRCVGEFVTLAVTGLDNLEYSGDTSWTFKNNLGDTNRVNLTVIIPENDTSGVGLTTRCSGRNEIRWLAFFTADAEKVSFFDYNPRRVSRTPIGVPIDMSDPPIEESWKHSAKMSPGGYMLFTKNDSGNFVPFVGYDHRNEPNLWGLTSEGEFVPWDSLEKLGSTSTTDSAVPAIKEGDRSKTWLVNKDGSMTQVDRQWLEDSVKQAKIEAEIEDMHQREENPCTYSSERIIVNGEVWQRRKGEYKFQKANR